MSEIKTELIFTPDINQTPQGVENDIECLWDDYELGNGEYCRWENSLENESYSEWAVRYPNLDAYLKRKNISSCLIHWSW